jgi:ArsR family transcriptional regulator
MMPGMEPPETAFRALADPIRLKIVRALARPEAVCCSREDRVSASDLERVVRLAQPSVSHHMKILTGCGLVESRKYGKYVYYRLNRTQFQKIASWLTEIAGESSEGRYPAFADEDAA